MPDRLLSRLRPKHRRLRFVLLVYVVVPLAITVGLGWFLTVARMEALAERRMQEEIELVARALSLPLSQALNQGSTLRLRQSLQAADDIYRVYGAYVFGPDGDLVAALGRSPQPDEPPLPEIASQRAGTGEYGELAGRRIYSYFVPLTDVGGRVNGILQVTRRRRDIDDHLWQLRAQAAAALTGFTMLFVGLVVWGHHRSLGRHIERLAGDMARIQEGDSRHRAESEGFQEITTLAESLNAMLDGIQRAQRELDSHRETQAALEAKLREAEKLAAIGGLAAGVAHELGTPLSVIQGRAQRLLRHDNLDTPVVDGIRDIRDQVRRMEEIVRQLLDFGRGRSSEWHVQCVADVVRRAAATVAESAAAAGVSIELRLDDERIGLLMDQAGLEQAVNNLLRNAVQAAPGGSVRLTLSPAADRLRIVVDDDGPGVPEELRSQVCDPFFTTKPVGQGTGLGLALAQRVVSDMGGQLTVGSSPLGGARFEIELPHTPPHARGAPS